MELKVAHIVFLTINLPTVHSNRQISKIEDIISDYLKDSASNPMIWHLYAQFKERTNQRDKVSSSSSQKAAAIFLCTLLDMIVFVDAATSEERASASVCVCVCVLLEGERGCVFV